MTDSSSTVPTNQNLSQTYGSRILRSAFTGWGAKLGLSWVIILAFIASFAPILANSMPLIAKKNGELVFPILKYLNAGDVFAMSVFVLVMVLWKLSLSFKKKLWLFAILTLLAGIAGNVFTSPPKIVVYEQFREQANEFEWTVLPPIPYSPTDYLRDFGDTSLEAPLADSVRTHIMGTDENGADVASRMIHASRIALSIGLIATGIAMFIGIIIGGQMGYFSGKVDMLGMRLVEVFEAIPLLILLLTFVAFFGRNIYMMMVIIGFTSWSGYARYIRAEFLKLRKQDYVQAAIASGLPLKSILFKHMLPNGVAPLLVAASFGVASAILAEAMLSFLGLGPVGAPSWGQMLNQAVKSSVFNWWMAVFPGGAIFLTVFAYNLMGEALRDAIDPTMTKRAGVA